MKNGYVGFILLAVLCMLCCAIWSEVCAGEDPRLRIEYLENKTGFGDQGDVVEVFDTWNGSSYTIERDYWDERRTMFCGCDKEPDIYGNPGKRKLSLKNTDNSILRELLKLHGWDQDLVEKFGFDSYSVSPYTHSCYPPKGLTALMYVIGMSSTQDHMIAICILDEMNDTLIFVDSCDDNRSGNCLGEFSLDYKGKNAYYRNGESVLRFNIASSAIDTIPHGDRPIIPLNSPEIMVYDKPERKLKLLDDQLRVRAWIEVNLKFERTIYSLGDDVFIIGNMAGRSGRKAPVMQLVYYDFKDGEVRWLFDAGPGQILNVERVP
ncbi:MAG: hypothetical protein KOO62_04545 [candidate division Zixibacteria bacterium]|nr:hypothetical protein [candidate division Zixibacteria bacterium]